MSNCEWYSLTNGDLGDCNKPKEIWATYPMGCPGVLWFGLCKKHFFKAVEEDLHSREMDGGGTWANDTQLVAYQDPSTLPNYGFPQYGKVEFNNVVK